jgi:lysophospholipase L1-like esterase
VPRRSHLPTLLANLSLAAVSAVVALGAAELLLRAVVPPSRGYFVLPPGADWTLVAAPGLLPGVEGVQHIRVNPSGVRGRTFGDDHAEYRILAVGGSTTRCGSLDETEAWPHLLEAQLGSTMDGRDVWVGNVGKDGATTRDHVLHLKYLLPQYPRIDAVVSLVGVNDMISALQQGWQYRLPDPVTELGAERAQMRRAFFRVPGRLQDPPVNTIKPVPWYKATALWQLGGRAKQAIPRSFRLEDFVRRGVRKARYERHTAAAWVDSLPPLESPLVEYRRNLNAMADLAAKAGVRLVFVTQPSMWREGMSAAEQRFLVFGALVTLQPPPWAYYTTGALGRAMARYNETLLDVCRIRHLDCVDAAPRVPRDTTALYDDVHFNANGSRLLARALVEHFRTRPPFRR